MGRRSEPRRRREEEREELDERVIDITRVAKVVKGGRRFAFRTTVVVGDNKGRVGIGVGKSRGVPDSIRKGNEKARRVMMRVPLSGSTVPHEVEGRCGGAVRAVLEAVGVSDILSKSQGSNNILNVAFATIDALTKLQDLTTLATMRGKSPEEILPFWERGKKD
jgi:small subunit ribosomal protein S5